MHKGAACCSGARLKCTKVRCAVTEMQVEIHAMMRAMGILIPVTLFGRCDSFLIQLRYALQLQHTQYVRCNVGTCNVRVASPVHAVCMLSLRHSQCLRCDSATRDAHLRQQRSPCLCM